jgi:cysteine desulfurase
MMYFDYASATPMSDKAIQAMQPYLQKDFFNPSALYLCAKDVKKDLDAFRARIASSIHVRPSEIYFVAGSSEANNMVVHGVMRAHPEARVLVSAIEHDSVMQSAAVYDVATVPVLESGIIDIASFKNSITDTTVLVSCMAANNEIGTVQPLAEIVAVIKAVRDNRKKTGNDKPLYLHVDASQSFNYVPLLPHEEGIDFAVVGGGKIYGPKQTAFLYKRASVPLLPSVYGGGQEYGLRSGTENVAGCAALCVAVEEAAIIRSAERSRLIPLQQQLYNFFESVGGVVNGSKKHRLPNNIHVTLFGFDNETLVMQLDEAGCMVATGSACHASSDEPSHVLKAIGLSDTDARSSIRITLGRGTTTEEIAYLTKSLTHILHR